MAYNTLKYEYRDHIGILTFNRPDRLNAFSPEMIEELRDFYARLCDDCEVRVVVVRGEGRAFCAGQDVRTMGAALSRDDGLGDVHYRYHKRQQAVADIVRKMRQAPQPLIAAVRGPAAGGGFAMALACDVRIAGESARFNTAFIRIGLSAGDMATSYYLGNVTLIKETSLSDVRA